MNRVTRRVVLSLIVILSGLQACKKNSSPSAPTPDIQAPTNTFTPLLSVTPTPTGTTGATGSPSPTSTSSSTDTWTQTSTPSSTPTPITSTTPTWTSSHTRTFTPTYTSTVTPTFTPTPRATDTPACGSMSRFGTDTQGASSGGFSYTVASRAVVAGPVTALSVTGYFASASDWVRVGLYSDNGTGSAPLSLLTQGTSSQTGAGWLTIDVPDHALAGPATYWIAFQTASGNVDMAYDAGPPGSRVTTFLNYPAGLPVSFAVNASGTDVLSAYVNTCP